MCHTYIHIMILVCIRGCSYYGHIHVHCVWVVSLQVSVEAAINSGNQSTIVDLLNLLLLKR